MDDDRPGYCALCHLPIAEFDGSNPVTGLPVIARLLPTVRRAHFLLNTGSTLVVTLCATCESRLTPEDLQPLMESVIRGWAWEVQMRLQLIEHPQALIGDRPSAYHLSPEAKTIVRRHLAQQQTLSIVNAVERPFSAEQAARIAPPRPDKMGRL